MKTATANKIVREAEHMASVAKMGRGREPSWVAENRCRIILGGTYRIIKLVLAENKALRKSLSPAKK